MNKQSMEKRMILPSNPQDWKPVFEYENEYLINQHGQIWSIKNGTFSKLSIGRGGYLQISVCRNRKRTVRFIHRLLLMAFNRLPQEKEQCNHKDGNKLNNNLENLEWVTPSENILHLFRELGYKPWNKGRKFPGSKWNKNFSEWQKNNICWNKGKKTGPLSPEKRLSFNMKCSKARIIKSTKTALLSLKQSLS